MTVELEPKSFVIGEGADGGKAVIKCADDQGREFEIKLDTMSMQTMASFLKEAFHQVASRAGQQHRVAPTVDRIALELGTKWETEILRLYVSPTVYHEYSVRSDTNLGSHFRELGRLIDEYQAERAAPSTDSKH